MESLCSQKLMGSLFCVSISFYPEPFLCKSSGPMRAGCMLLFSSSYNQTLFPSNGQWCIWGRGRVQRPVGAIGKDLPVYYQPPCYIQSIKSNGMSFKYLLTLSLKEKCLPRSVCKNYQSKKGYISLKEKVGWGRATASQQPLTFPRVQFENQ